MTERNLGERLSWWTGSVVDVKDPHESGRLKIRVYGMHDDKVNIPDSALPWALPIQPVTSAAIGKIGSAPVGAVVGTKVVGFWADADFQYPIIWGTIGKSGDPIAGEFENGAPKIDWSVGSIPSAAQASTPHPYNPYAQVGGRAMYSIADIDAGIKSIFSVRNTDGVRITEAAQEGMRHRATPTIGYATVGDRRDVLDISRDVNPMSINSPFPCLLLGMTSLRDLLAYTSSLVSAAASVVRNIVAAAIRNAILNLAIKLGIYKVINALNIAASKIAEIQSLLNSLNIQICGRNLINQGLFDAGNLAFAQAMHTIDAAAGFAVGAVTSSMNISDDVVNRVFNSVVARPLASIATADTPVPISSLVQTRPPDDYVRYYYGNNPNPYPGYTRWVNPNGEGTVYVKETSPDYRNVQQHTQFATEDFFSEAIGASLLSGKFNPQTLTSALIGATGFARTFAVAGHMGKNFKSVMGGASPIMAGLVGAAIFANLTQNIRPAIRGSVIEGTMLGRAVDNFAEGQAILARRAREIRVGIGQRLVS